MLVIVGALALAGCGGDEGRNEPTVNAQSCAEAFRGATFERIDDLPSTCNDSEGATRAYATATYECEDGGVLWWNDIAWGYLGQPAVLHAEGAELVPPEDEREACGYS